MHPCEPISPAAGINNYPSLLLQIILLFVLQLVAPFVAGCRSNDPAAAAARAGAASAPITISSTSLQNGRVPKKFTCDGNDTSPTLNWTAPPSGTRSLVLTVTDPDAPGGTFTHWVLFNVPASSNALPAGVPTQGQLTDGSRQGQNDFGKPGYGGPCPPRGSTHRYFFDLFALDKDLDLPSGATRAQVEDAIGTHVLARSKLMARYGR